MISIIDIALLLKLKKRKPVGFFGFFLRLLAKQRNALIKFDISDAVGVSSFFERVYRIFHKYNVS